MSKRFSSVISWVCISVMVVVPMVAVWLLIDLATFVDVVKQKSSLPIFWETVHHWQWLAQWLLTVLYVSIGLIGLYYLHLAFSNFAKGEWFTQANSANLRRFSLLLIAQVIAKPVYFALSSVLLSFNHPAGQKVLCLALGSGELKALILAMILWVVSDLLIAGSKLQSENRQFI